MNVTTDNQQFPKVKNRAVFEPTDVLGALSPLADRFRVKASFPQFVIFWLVLERMRRILPNLVVDFSCGRFFLTNYSLFDMFNPSQSEFLSFFHQPCILPGRCHVSTSSCYCIRIGKLSFTLYGIGNGKRRDQNEKVAFGDNAFDIGNGRSYSNNGRRYARQFSSAPAHRI
jgi:hypothetical protein